MALLVHGSRDRAWLEPFRELAAAVAIASGARVELACLQFGSPDLGEAIGRLAGEGFASVVVVPTFISARGHVTKDVPRALEAARKKFPELRIELAEAVGEQPEVRAALLACLVRLAAGD